MTSEYSLVEWSIVIFQSIFHMILCFSFSLEINQDCCSKIYYFVKKRNYGLLLWNWNIKSVVFCIFEKNLPIFRSPTFPLEKKKKTQKEHHYVFITETKLKRTILNIRWKLPVELRNDLVLVNKYTSI